MKKNIQSIRTFIAALAGVLIVRLVAAVPAIAAVLAWTDGVFAAAGYAAISTLALVESVVTAATIVGYVKLAQWLGDRWPNVEKMMSR